MHKVKKFICVMACATSALVAPIQVNASGAVAGATEITQLLNNAQLAMDYGESLKHTYELVRQSYLQAQGLWHDIQNIEQIGKNIIDGQLNIFWLGFIRDITFFWQIDWYGMNGNRYSNQEDNEQNQHNINQRCGINGSNYLIIAVV